MYTYIFYTRPDRPLGVLPDQRPTSRDQSTCLYTTTPTSFTAVAALPVYAYLQPPLDPSSHLPAGIISDISAEEIYRTTAIMAPVTREENPIKRQRVDVDPDPEPCYDFLPPDVSDQNGRTTTPLHLSADVDFDAPEEAAPSKLKEPSPTRDVPEENKEEIQGDESTSKVESPPKQDSTARAGCEKGLLTEQERRQRAQLIIKQYETLMMHAAECKSTCTSKNCATMKRVFKHTVECQITYFNGCPICRGPGLCMLIHARNCKLDSCPVPTCNETRDALELGTPIQQVSISPSKDGYC